MKKSLFCILFILLSASLQPVCAATEIFIDPKLIDQVNENSFDVRIRDVVDLISFRFIISYPSDVVQLEATVPETDYIFENTERNVLSPNITDDPGSLTYTVFTSGTGPGVTQTEATLAHVTFQMKKQEDAALTFTEAKVTDGAFETSAAPAVGGEIALVCRITFSDGTGGSVAPVGDPRIDSEGKVVVKHDENQGFTMAPDDCYHIADVTIDSVEPAGPVASHTFYGISQDHTLYASFSNTLIIEASAGEGGTISDSVPVACGEDKTFTITPASCHQIKDVKVDGSSVRGDVETDENGTGTYTVVNVRNGHTIHAEFEKILYTITPMAGDHGTIDPSNEVTVECGDEPVFIITPADCHQIEDVIVGDAEEVSVKADVETDAEGVETYTFPPVAKDQTMEVTFSRIAYTVEIEAGDHGSVQLMLDDEEQLKVPGGDAGTVPMDCGAEPMLIITPDACHEIADVEVNDTSVGDDIKVDGFTGSYTLPAVRENQHIDISLAIREYTITVTETDHVAIAVTEADDVTIDPSGTISVECGSEPAFTMTPVPLPPEALPSEDGYEIADIMVGDESVMEDENMVVEDWVGTSHQDRQYGDPSLPVR